MAAMRFPDFNKSINMIERPVFLSGNANPRRERQK
jgi:hypothetical protein